MKIVGKDLLQARVVINGAGMAGLVSADLLVKAGIKQVIVSDRDGALYKYRPRAMSWAKWEIVKKTNPENFSGTLEKALKGANVFVGLSIAGALIVATGRSDFPNQVNNSLVFPGIFRGPWMCGPG